MKLQTMFAVLVACSISSAAFAQNSGTVYDVSTDPPTMLGQFDAGNTARGVAWTSTTAGFVSSFQSFARLDITNPGFPFMTTILAPLYYPLGSGIPGPFAVNAAGTRAFIAGVVSGSVGGAGVYDVTGSSDIAALSNILPDTSSVTACGIFRDQRMGIFPAGTNVIFADLTTDPTFTPMIYPLLSDTGTAAPPLTGLGVAVTEDPRTAAISLADGGMRLLDASRLPPVRLGQVIRPDGCASSPSIIYLPRRIAGDATIAITCGGAASQLVLIDIEGGTPAIVNTVVLPPALNNAQAIAFNPRNGDIYLANSTTIGIVPALWTTVARTIALNPPRQIERSGLTVSPDGHYLMVVGHQ